MVMLGVKMDNQGARLVQDLLAMDVTTWRIARECGVSYQTAKAWKRGWWNPDEANTHKLFALRIKIERERKAF